MSKAPFLSPRRVLALGVNTLTELTRLKVFYFLLIFALVIIGFSSYASQMSAERSDTIELQMLKDVALGAMSIFTSLIAILATAMLIPKDLEDRTIFTILAKPVPRFEYVAGKLFGIILLLAISILVMTGLFLGMLWLKESSLIAAASSQDAPNQEAREIIAQYIAEVRGAAFTANLFPGIVAIFCQAAVVAAMTLLISTFASSAIFTMMVAFAAYFIGYLQTSARENWLSDEAGKWWTEGLTALVALIFPDMQAFSFNDQIVAGVAIPAAIFLKTVGLGAIYVTVYYLIGSFLLSTREL